MGTDDTAALAGLLTEARNPASANLDQLSTLEMLTLINAEDAKVADAVHAELPAIAAAVDAIAARFGEAGGCFISGQGRAVGLACWTRANVLRRFR